MTQTQTGIDVAGLLNSGMLVVHDSAPIAPQRTFIVLGVARGGTTMVAKALRELGIHMGDRLSAVQEDTDVCRPMEEGDVPALREVIARRDAAHGKWGFKRPGATSYIRDYQGEFRNPCFLIVFRDIFALTNRNRLSVGQDPLQGLKSAAQQYVKLAELASSLRAPTLLMSYEKALLDPAAFAAGVAAFAGVDDARLIERATGAVDPGNAQYLEESRSRRGLGRLDGVVGRLLKGWATVTGLDEPVDVRLTLNGRELGVVCADRPRADLVRFDPSGARAFEFVLPDEVEIAPGDVLGARIVGEIKDLGNSPLKIAAPKPPPQAS